MYIRDLSAREISVYLELPQPVDNTQFVAYHFVIL